MKPKIEPKRRCARGHLQAVSWRHGDECFPCRIADNQAREAVKIKARNDADKAAFRALFGNPPVLIMGTMDTGRVVRLAIPPRLAAQKKAQDKRRGRRRGARI